MLFSLFFNSYNLYSTQYDTGWFELKQPDGTTFVCRKAGDEYEYHYITHNGYAFNLNLKDGYYYYARDSHNKKYHLFKF